MKLKLANTIKARGSSTAKDALLKNSIADEKKGQFYVLKRPAMDAAISALSGTGQLLFPGPLSAGTATGPIAITGDDVTTYSSWSMSPAKLRGDTEVSTGAVLTAIPPFTFNAKDVFDNAATGFTGAVTLTLASNPHGATLGGTTSVSASAGVADFSAVTINRIGGNYKFRATATGLGSALSNEFKIVSTMNFTTLPSTSLPDVTFSVVVTVKDSGGNTATGYNGNVTLSIDSNPGSPAGVLSGTLTQTASNGVATFNDLSIDSIGNGYTLRATDGTTNLVSVVSSSFNISNSEVITVTRAFDGEYNYGFATTGSAYPAMGSVSPSTVNGQNLISVLRIPAAPNIITWVEIAGTLTQDFFTSIAGDATFETASATFFSDGGGSGVSVWSWESASQIFPAATGNYNVTFNSD